MDEEEFVRRVVSWVKLDDSIDEMTKALREIKAEKKKEEDAILSYMSANEQDVLKMSSGGSLRRSVSRVRTTVTSDHVMSVVTGFVKSQTEAELLTEAIFRNRPITERAYLKRLKPKKKQ